MKCVVASTMARARGAGSSLLKMPEPTNTASAPSCIASAASAGVAMPPAQNSGTGSQPVSAISCTSGSGACSCLAQSNSSAESACVILRMSPMIERRWRTASTMLPVPASPFERIIAAPSLMRRSASPRLVAPHTNGTVNVHLSMWWASSAGLSTSDSSTKSTPSASRIWASTKWPMRALAMTGIETAALMPSIISGSLIRETPPSRRMSAGTRSSAITAQAPASSAILACSGVTTSMITPPLSISARPRLTGNEPVRRPRTTGLMSRARSCPHRTDRRQRFCGGIATRQACQVTKFSAL